MIRTPTRIDWLGWLGAALMIGAFVAVLGHFVDVVAVPGEVTSGATRFYAVVGAAMIAGTILARLVSARVAVPLGIALFVGGLWWYLSSIDAGAIDIGKQAAYVATMLAGQSVLDIQSLETWILGVTPAPVFLGWYLAVRRHYVLSAVVGSLSVGTLVATGDAGQTVTLMATVGGLALLAAAAIDSHGGSFRDGTSVAPITGIAVVVALSVSIVPAAGAFAYHPATGLQASGGGSSGSLNGGLHPGGDRLTVQGAVSLSPRVLFQVQSERGTYWRTGAYDTYTGGGWIRRSDPADRWLQEPVGPSTRVSQRYEVHRRMTVMPAVWRPTNVSGERGGDVLTDGLGGLVPRRPLTDGDSYRVTSAAPAATQAQLRTAEGPIPDSVAETSLQLPASTPDRVGQRAARVSANADSPYETAVAIEQYLESAKGYSVSISRPQGSVADSFLFEMDEGYCVYFATTMTVMLRTQGVPARMVTGYTTGQRIGPNEWVVRGQNAHAWVEVYLSGVGWVRFDPTPAGPRTETTEQRLETAREAGLSNVDVNGSSEGEWTPPTPDTTATPETGGTTIPPDPHAVIGAPLTPGSGQTLTTTPTPTPADDRDRAAWWLWLVGVAGLAVGVRQIGLAAAGYRLLWLLHQPRDDPASDIERAFQRTMALVETTHRPRRPAESVGSYLDAIDADETVRRVAHLRERVRYAGRADESAANRARSAAADVRRAAGLRTVFWAALGPVRARLPWSPDSV